MRRSQRPWLRVARFALLLTIFGLSSMVPVTSSPAMVTQESKDIEAVRSELFELLRLSPKLTTAISADPTLLADEAYVSRNNPELAEFLHSHPEVVRNPEFYLFFPSNFPGKGGRQRFEATVWPELQGPGGRPDQGWNEERIVVFLVFVLVLAALLWIFRIVLENNKWNKLSKMHNQLYGKLLDKCSSNEELLAFFRTSAGKPFFDLAAIEPHAASPLNRVFLPLQFGIVLTLAGGGFLSFLYSHAGDARRFFGPWNFGLRTGYWAYYFSGSFLLAGPPSGTAASASQDA